MLTINVAVLLAFIVVMRLRRRTEPRTPFDEKLGCVLILVLGVLIAPTDFGQGILHVTGQIVQGLSGTAL